MKVGLFARLSPRLNRNGEPVTRLQQRRLVAVLGDMATFQPRLQLEAFRQGIETASQVVWLSDEARGFWQLFEACFSHLAVGIFDFYHAAAYLWQAADAYQDGLPEIGRRWGLRAYGISSDTVMSTALLMSCAG